MTIFSLKRAVAAVVAAMALSTTACSLSLDQLPLPAPGVGHDAYTLTATFTNALNLPTKAKVRLNGADVGEVESMVATNYTALVTMRIRSGVLLPVGTAAELRSATPLGDVFVALIPPARTAPGAATLGNGANIPLTSTSAASTIEELLTRASLLVNGGAIESATTLLNHLGDAVGGRGDRLATMIEQTRQLLDNLAARSDQIRQVLAKTGDLSATLARQQTTLTDAIAAGGPALRVVGDNIQNMVDLVGRIDLISQQLSRFPSIKGSNDRSLVGEINLLAADLNAGAVNPNANLDPLISIIPIVVQATDGSSAHANVGISQLALGAAPDPNFPGDAGARLPEATDWTNFVGSLEYSLNQLRDKVIGPGR